MSLNAIRAFGNPMYKYYELTEDVGFLKKGAIFYHDENDKMYGSIANGCLKLCWTPDGNCYSGLCGGTVIFHSNFAKDKLFKEVKFSAPEMLNHLQQGSYEVKVHRDGSWTITKHGEMLDDGK